MKSLTLTTVFIFSVICASAQTSISFETQAYPAGFIPGVRVDYSINEHVQLFARGAYNFTDRRDWGVQDNEEGNGTGFGIGIEFGNSRFENLLFNVRTDLWFMDIDWMDNRFIPCPLNQICTQTLDAVPRKFNGNTELVILQPTIGFGYQMPLSGSFFLKPSINIGYEINIKTDGEDVGEGAILLGGIQFGYLLDAK